MKTVLVIEDDVMIRILIAAVLEPEWRVVFAEERDKLVAQIEEVDLIISDYNAPPFDFNATKELCKSKNKPLVLQTGSREELGHPYRLQKPYNLGSLLTEVSRAFAMR